MINPSSAQPRFLPLAPDVTVLQGTARPVLLDYARYEGTHLNDGRLAAVLRQGQNEVVLRYRGPRLSEGNAMSGAYGGRDMFLPGDKVIGYAVVHHGMAHFALRDTQTVRPNRKTPLGLETAVATSLSDDVEIVDEALIKAGVTPAPEGMRGLRVMQAALNALFSGGFLLEQVMEQPERGIILLPNANRTLIVRARTDGEREALVDRWIRWSNSRGQEGSLE